jgi:ABC-2 type transport system permease protein
VGVVIPRGATAEVANAANLVANSVSARLGMGTLPVRAPRDSVYVRIFFDPVAKPTFRMSVSFALEKYINYSGTQVLMERLSRMAGVSADSSQATLAATFRGLGIREEQLSSRGVDTALVNSVQHNVPAWAIFGMFFIVVPIAGHMIREREEGSALRLALIPSSVPFVSLGKVCFYVLVCMTQFFLMLAIGICLLPMLGLPRLSLGAHPWALLPVAACISFNATAYGYFIGSVFRTPNQALPFGAISVVILSALGGIWIPTDILPPLVQRIALISPLYWALDSVNQLFLRNLGLAEVTRHMLILTGAGAALWLFAYLRNSRRAAGIQ